MADSKTYVFGKSYNNMGDTDANLCLCTSGDVKIKTKHRYVTIFKDGKLNVDDTSEIYAVSSVDDMKKTGIYLVTESTDDGESQSVYLYVDGTKILLATSGEGYVSYTAVQELTAENFLQALQNIGFYFQTLDDAKASSMTEGLAYILDERKLYKIVDGEFVELSATTSTDDSTESGESGETSEELTSLQIGGILIDGESYLIDSDSTLFIQLNGTDYIILRADKIYMKKDVVFSKTEEVYIDGSVKGESGFYLYMEDGESYLEVDNIIVHNSASDYEPSLYKAYVGTSVKNLVTGAEWSSAPTDFSLTLKYENEFAVGDYVLIQTASGNELTISYETSAISSEDDETEVQVIEATLESAPSQTTVIKVTYEVQTGEDESETREVTITIEPTAYDDDDGAYVENNYGYAEVSADNQIDGIITATIESGDEDIYYSGDSDGSESSGGKRMPSPLIGTVTAVDPLVVNVPDNANGANSILTNLVYSPIYKIGSASETGHILYVSSHNLSLQESAVTAEDGDAGFTRTTISRMGNLDDLGKTENVYDGGATSEQPVEGYGIYSDNAAFQKARYTSDYELDKDDDSSKFASTEWVQGILEEMSYPDITITGDPNGYMVADGHNIDVTALMEALEEVASRYDPGYYYSSSASDGSPVDPVYWGTSSEGFELYEGGHDYLWYTNDGVTWKLVMQYMIDPDDPTEYYYVCTTIRGIYVQSSGANVYFPAGFCTFMRYTSASKTSTTQYSPLGASYYMSYDSAQYQANGVTAADINARITLLDTLLSASPSPVVNMLPTNYSEYHYVWRITVSDFNTYGGDDYTKWSLCAMMEGAGDEDLVTSVASDIGNFAGFPGVKWVTYDGSSGALLFPSDATVTNAYPHLVGSPDNWADETWVKYFLMAIIYDFCSKNKAFYGETLGFNFNSYQTSVTMTGYGGWVNGRLGTFVAPTSSVDYATPYFLWLNGSLYGYLGYRVDFFFQQVCIGKATDIYMVNQSITAASSIPSLIAGGSSQGPFYDVTSWHQSSYAIVTDMSTGKRTLCRYTGSTWGATAL